MKNNKLIFLTVSFHENRQHEQNFIKSLKKISILVFDFDFTLEDSYIFNFNDENMEENEDRVLKFLSEYNKKTNFLIIQGNGISKFVDIFKLDLKLSIIDSTKCIQYIYPDLTSIRINDIVDVLNLKEDKLYKKLLSKYIEKGYSIEILYLVLLLKKIKDETSLDFSELSHIKTISN